MRPLKPVAIWLFVCAALVFAMAVIGAITRLTESGLSMVQWQPLHVMPPLSDAAWQEEFAHYQMSPQYLDVNQGMSLDEYKHIYYWEWFHRLLGRTVGVVFLLPFLWFLARGTITRALAPKLILLFALGGLQGFIGWFMVRSGLNDRPSVSHYRLAMHLALALFLYAALLWTALSLLYSTRTIPVRQSLRGQAVAGLALVATTMVWGAFVAGLRAGLIYNTFPLMGGHIFPGEGFTLQPWWINFFANHATVQFTHRLLALTTALTLLALWARIEIAHPVRPVLTIARLLAIAVVCQVGLGISTLVLAVPVTLGALHQAGAITVLTLTLLLLFWTRAPAHKTAGQSPPPAL